MPSAKRVLLIGGDTVPRASLAEQLALAGVYAVVTADDPGDMPDADESYAFILVDSDLPDSARLADALAARGFNGPVILLGGEADISAPVARIAKPFRVAALIALAQRLASEKGARRDAPRIGPYLFHANAKTLVAGDRKIRLTEKETDILKFLHASGGTVSRQTLLHEVWGYNPAVTTHTLETHIYRLRRKIEQGESLLVTEEGGYRLLG